MCDGNGWELQFGGGVSACVTKIFFPYIIKEKPNGATHSFWSVVNALSVFENVITRYHGHRYPA
jgi:hypothetical protein